MKWIKSLKSNSLTKLKEEEIENLSSHMANKIIELNEKPSHNKNFKL